MTGKRWEPYDIFWFSVMAVLVILCIALIVVKIYTVVVYWDTPIKDLPYWVVWFNNAGG